MEVGDVTALLIIGAVIVYFVPTIVAFGKKHTNKLAIFILNFFLGWSLIGWVIALIWAVKKKEK